MTRNIKEHEKDYWHIRKPSWRLIVFFLSLALIVYNAYIIVVAYPEAPLRVALPSVIVWILWILGTFNLLYEKK